MLYFVDADQNGLDSVQDVIAKNHDKVTIINAGVFEEADRRLAQLVEKTGPNDLFVFDTIDALANTLRGDAKLGNDQTEELWVKRNLWLQGDKNYQTVYDMAEKFILRRIKNLRNRGARIICLAHEAEKVDEQDMLKKRGPDLNDKFYGKLMSASSDVFRLSVQLTNVVNAAGEVIVPADTRILELRRTPEVIAKYHVGMDKSPQIKAKMMNPTLPKLYEHLGKKPSFLTIYGAPGAGKTSFSFSELTDIPKVKKENKQ